MHSLFLKEGIFVKKSWLEECFQKGMKEMNIIYNHYINTCISKSSEIRQTMFDFKESKGMINSKFMVQVDEIVDISLDKPKRLEFVQAQNGTKKYFFSCGNVKIIGFENEPISSITPLTKPGTKVTIIPPVTIRYGVMFLSEKNIQVVGGSSDDLELKRKHILEDGKANDDDIYPSSSQKSKKSSKKAEDDTSKSKKKEKINSTMKTSSDDNSAPTDTRLNRALPPVGFKPYVEPVSSDSQTKSQNVFSFLSSDSEISEEPESIRIYNIGEISKLNPSPGTVYPISSSVICIASLESNGMDYQCTCQLKDRTGSLNVEVDPQFIAVNLDISPLEWNTLPSNIRNIKFQRVEDMLVRSTPPLRLIENKISSGSLRFRLL